MSRSKDVSLVSRNRDILADVRSGMSYQATGDKWGLSKQRIAQLVQESQESVSDDGWRSLDFTRLDDLGENLLGKFYGPDAPLVSARGVVYETLLDADGSPVYTQSGNPKQDLSRPVPDTRLKIELALAYTKIQERKAKLTGTDRLKARAVDQSREQEEFLAYVQGLADQNDALRKQVDMLSRDVIEAEIIPEDPSSSS